MSNIAQDASLHKENLAARQLYQKALELGKQLNVILSQDDANQETFKPESLTLRNQLQQLCIKLMFLNPVEYGEKAEELLWVNVYYNVIQLRFKDGIHHANISETDFEKHLDNGVKFYQNLFSFLQEHYELELSNNRTQRNIIDCRRLVSASEKEVDWARMACYHCLLYLGDLFSFQSHVRSMNLKNLAVNYYFQALSVVPHMGLPYNRLASLVSDKYCHVDAAFFYQCSMHSDVPARDASFRLRNLYTKSVEMYNQEKKCQLGMPSSGQEKYEYNKRLLVHFLYLQNFLQPDSCMDPRLVLLSQSILEDFRLCLSSKVKGEHKEGFFLSDHIIFHMVTLCIMSVYSLKKTVGVSQSRAAITFILVLFSHLVHHVTIRIQSELDGMGDLESQKTNDVQWEDSDLPVHNFGLHSSKPLDIPQYSHPSEQCYHCISSTLENDSYQSQDHHSNGDWDSHNPLDKDDSWGEAIFSLSLDSDDKKWPLSVGDKEVNCPLILDKQLEWRDSSKSQSPIMGGLGTFSSSPMGVLDTSKAISTNLPTLGNPEFQTQHSTLKRPHPEFKTVTGEKCPESDTLSNITKKRLCGQAHIEHKLRKKLSIFASQELLYTIKVFLNWLWIDPDLTLECTHSSPRLWSHLSALLNLLPTIQELQGAHLGLSSHLWDLVMISEESDLPISLLLPEDSGICNLLPMKVAHERICFIQVPPLLNLIEKGILYTCFLRSFGHFAAQVSHSLLSFYPSQASYRSVTSFKSYLKSQEGAPSSSFTKNVSQQLLHPELSSVHAHRLLPLYLLPDTQALCQYLPVIRELIMDDSFIVIISSAVMDELIALKHKEPGACAAINFLKDKLKEKRYCHPCFQKNAGKKDVRSSMNKENPDSRDLHQILEECKDLVRGPRTEVDDRSQRMIILTGFSVNSPRTFSHPLLSDFQTSASVSVEIKHTLQFYREWKMIR
ncbi:nonsense-mediated mRNA decay factor SMG5-like [Petaurus breviceps papuanus]|uniref:nonsense-mediated mRNA decay factor SMG5-like n=1 Tax=Petaurus breviceps papuanus TaxID=3040969 RepID=UPI0036DD157E